MIDLEATDAAVRRTAAIGSVLALFGAASYGVNIVFARVCAQIGITGADIIVYRSLILLPGMALLVLLAGKSFTVPAAERPLLIRFAVSAAATALCYLTSLQYLSVPLAVTIFYTYPLIVMVLTPLVDGLRLPARRWVAAGIAFTGVGLAVGPSLETLDMRGLLFAALGSLCCAAMFITGSRLQGDGRVTFFWCQVAAVPAALGFALIGGGLSPPEMLGAAALPFAITSACYFCGFLLQILAAPRISAATASLLFLLEPMAAIAGAALLLGETLGILQSLGITLVIGALVADLLPALRRPGASPARP